ncbi:MAG TPA: hypothetical protein VJS64_20390 [Pyrinomonadaceae bacterium]|nr:hypothetical protein [Pyrinomonadaceae bacterium]
MKQCPVCRRTFTDDLKYCLEDGSVLQAAKAPDPTEIYPREQETTVVYPSPRPAAAPAQFPQQKSSVGKVLAVIGTILFILLIAFIKIGVWWFERQERNADQANSSSPQFLVPTPNASPIVTPEATPVSSPTPLEASVSVGSYQCEINRNLKVGEVERAATLKLRISLSSDNTYLQQGYATIHGTEVTDQLIIEEKGTFSQTDDLLILQNRQERELDKETYSWQAWKTPKEGSEVQRRVRNVTAATFQLFDPDENAWFTFTKM